MTSPEAAWEKIKPFAMADLGEMLGQYGGSGGEVEAAGLILLYDTSDGLVLEYSHSQDGFAGAVAAAGANDVIFVPPGTVAGNHTIPAVVTVFGLGPNTVFSGNITNNGEIYNARISGSLSGGGNATLVEYSNVDAFFAQTDASNIAIGSATGSSLDGDGEDNIIIGDSAGTAIEDGSDNILLGASAGVTIDSGIRNIGIGRQAGEELTSGGSNIFLGYDTGGGITTGSYNVVIGSSVGGLSSSLANTIIIADGQGNQRLYIDSGGKTGINTQAPATMLHVDQDSATGALPVATFDQADVDEPLLKFVGTSEAAGIGPHPGRRRRCKHCGRDRLPAH